MSDRRANVGNENGLLGCIIIVLCLLLAGCDRGGPATPTRATAPPASATVPPAQPDGATATISNTATPQVSPSPDRQAQLRAFLTQSNVFAFIAPEGQLRLATPGGDTVELWTERVTGLVWSPDGQRLAFVSAGTLYIQEIGAEAQEPRALLSGLLGDQQPSWSADGSTIAISSGKTVEEAELLLVDVASGKITTLGSGSYPRFAPQGWALLAASIKATQADAEGPPSVPLIWPSTEAAPLAIATAENTIDWSRIAWSADGALAAASSVLLDRDGQIVERLAPPGSHEITANGLAPNGRWLAIATLVDGAQPGTRITELSIRDRTTGQQHTVWRSEASRQTGSFWRLSPVRWSPDGTILSFAGVGQTLGSAPIQGSGIWIGTADGSELGPLIGSGEAQGPAAFSPDRSQLLFVKREATNTSSIWVWEPGSGQDPRRLLEGSAPLWRP